MTLKNPMQAYRSLLLHLGQKCLRWVACLWSKIPMFQRAGMREGLWTAGILSVSVLFETIWLNLKQFGIIPNNSKQFQLSNARLGMFCPVLGWAWLGSAHLAWLRSAQLNSAQPCSILVNSAQLILNLLPSNQLAVR